MLRRFVIGGAAAVALVVAVIAIIALRPPEQASAPIQAIPLAPTVAATEAPAAATEAPAAATEAPAAATEAPAAATEAPAAATEAPAAATSMLFEIVPAESEARFLIDEVLRGAPVTVAGTTDQVAGQIAVDPSNPASTRLGVIQINARTLATDNEFRNRAIKNVILRTNEFEFVTFTPTAITGLPENVSVGQPITFQITGELTVTDVTRPVTFDVTVTPVSESELEGLASTTILYRDFGLTIPDSPAVDTVADEVRLELAFVARPVSS